MTDRLDSQQVLARHLQELTARDSRLAAIAERVGPLAIRKAEPGFSGMARTICGQQLSIASANAIWSRFAALPGALEPDGYLQLGEAEIRAAGLSAGKYRTVRALAAAILAGELDLDRLDDLPAADATKRLLQISGIGQWTAEIYLMFCAGHPDIFPAGDLALQKAVAHALGFEARLPSKELTAIAEAWSPHRHAAALLFWRYYAVVREREGMPL